MSKLFYIIILLLLCGFKVHDGDTFTQDSGEVIRLYGVDAPEMYNPYTNCAEQTCYDKTGKNYRCAYLATKYLRNLMERGVAICEAKGVSYGRTVGDCHISELNISRAMVLAGWAMEVRYFSHGEFTAEENEAKKYHRGIWQGNFTNPYIYRKTCQ